MGGTEPGRRLAAPTRLEFFQDVVYVVLDGGVADPQRPPDLLRLAFADKIEDLPLAPRQRLGLRRARNPGRQRTDAARQQVGDTRRAVELIPQGEFDCAD